MNDDVVKALVSIVAGITGVAVLALILSPKARTAQVISAASSGYSNALATALGPVTGYMPSGAGIGGFGTLELNSGPMI